MSLLRVLQVVGILLAVAALSPAMAHALELPGKLRLAEDQYRVVQRIYYPGFTIGGFAEVASAIVALVLLVVTPAGSPSFWFTLVAAIGLVAMQAVYWLVTHPVNRFWLEGQALGTAGTTFFAVGSGRGERREAVPLGRTADWTSLRDRWEYSHVARALLAGASLLALLAALTAKPCE